MADIPAGLIDATGFGVAATLVYDVFSATNSSPQTTELFASERADTLWKYVKLGGIQAAILVAIMFARSKSVWPILGGLTAGLFMWFMYSHALKSGQGKTKTGGCGCGGNCNKSQSETLAYGVY